MQTIIFLLIAHWFFDFAMQDEKDALNKNHSLKHLFNHVNEYSAGMFLSLFIYCLCIGSNFIPSFMYALTFWCITFICHFVTDYFTSKESHKRYKANKFYGINGFWSIIGFDQLLHALQILLTIYFI